MGLDNGVIIASKTKEFRDKIPKKWIRWSYDNGAEEFPDHPFRTEVMYWRKCWGLRDLILRNCFPDYNKDQYYFVFDREKLTILYDVIVACLELHANWEDMRSIWTWDEIKSTMLDARQTCAWLIDQVVDKEDVIIYFYDSY